RATLSTLFPYTTLFRSGAMAAAFAFIAEEATGEPEDSALEEIGLMAAIAAGARTIVFAAVEAYEGEGGEKAAIPLLMAGRERIADRKSTRLNSSHVKTS